MRITNFDQLVQAALERGPKTVAVVAPYDKNSLEALYQAQQRGLARCILVGDPDRINATAQTEGIDLSPATTVAVKETEEAAHKAVALCNEELADMVMNGSEPPRYLIDAILDRENGLRAGRLMTDVTIFEIPGFDRLIFLSDIAMVVSPTLEQRIQIVQNAIDVAHRLGIETPRVAILAATELVNPKIPLSMDAANLSKMAQRKQIVGGIVDGPLALDNAISLEAAQIKGIKSEVAGRADILIAPDIEAGNILAKTITYFGKGKMASVIFGGRVPVIMPSRADPSESKFISIALGVLLS